MGREAGVIGGFDFGFGADPVAHLGYQEARVDPRNVSDPHRVQGEYYPPNWNRERLGGVPNTIRVRTEPVARSAGDQQPYFRMPVSTALMEFAQPTDPAVIGMSPITEPVRRPDPYRNMSPIPNVGGMTRIDYVPPLHQQSHYPEVVRHEYRHSGAYNLLDAARRAGIATPQFRSPEEPLAASDPPETRYMPHEVSSEEANVFEDRRRGFPESYMGMIEYTPEQTQFYEQMTAHMRALAEQILADRVRRLHASPSGTRLRDLR
jgi:hypothetical protein